MPVPKVVKKYRFSTVASQLKLRSAPTRTLKHRIRDFMASHKQKPVPSIKNLLTAKKNLAEAKGSVGHAKYNLSLYGDFASECAWMTAQESYKRALKEYQDLLSARKKSK